MSSQRMSSVPDVEPRTLTVTIEEDTLRSWLSIKGVTRASFLRFVRREFEYYSIGLAVKELIEVSHKIYADLLAERKQITVICGGNSAAYFCYAMSCLPIYNPDRVNFFVLPYSKGRDVWQWKEQQENNEHYCARFHEWLAEHKPPKMYKSIVYLDQIYRGIGLYSVRHMVEHCFAAIHGVEHSRVIAINPPGKVPSMAGVDKVYFTYLVYLFPELMPRLVSHYPPSSFPIPGSLEPYFIGVKTNPFLPMIKSCAAEFPEKPIKENPWYTLNMAIPPEIKLPESSSERRRTRKASNSK